MSETDVNSQSKRRIYGVGIIGAGGIFAEHARGYAQLPATRIVALADVDDERMRRASKDFFIPFTTSNYNDLLVRPDVDIVDICTPPSLHEEISVIYQLRYSPEARRIAWLRDNDYLGDLRFGRFSRYGTLPGGAQSGKGWWGRWSVAGGGALMTQCIHEIDLILQIFGPAKSVTARMATLGGAIESEDTFSATIEMQSGAVITCFCSLAGRSNYAVNWDVVGGSGSAHYPWGFQSVDRGHRAAAQKESVKRFPSPGKRNLLPGLAGKVVARIMNKLGIGKRSDPSRHKPYFESFIKSIENGAEVPVTACDARRSLELCTAIYTAALTREPVTLPLGPDSRFYHGITTDDYDGRLKGTTA
jgi:predicted dehydrogenase